jgi:hypothetical protein
MAMTARSIVEHLDLVEDVGPRHWLERILLAR